MKIEERQMATIRPRTEIEKRLDFLDSDELQYGEFSAYMIHRNAIISDWNEAIRLLKATVTDTCIDGSGVPGDEIVEFIARVEGRDDDD